MPICSETETVCVCVIPWLNGGVLVAEPAGNCATLSETAGFKLINHSSYAVKSDLTLLTCSTILV